LTPTSAAVYSESSQLGENVMTTVTFTFYGKYQNQKTFDTYEKAKAFFWRIQRARGVTKVELN